MFWQSIAPMLDAYKLTITIQKNKNGTLTAIFVPKPHKDNACISPISVTGTPQEFDSPEIYQEIVRALAKASGNAVNITNFMLSIEVLEKKRKEEEAKKREDAKKKQDKPAVKSSTPAKPVKTEMVKNPDWVAPADRDPELEAAGEYDDEPEFIEQDVMETPKPVAEQASLFT